MEPLLEGVSRSTLSERGGRISSLYRAGKASAEAVRDWTDALAYVVSRLPATYAALRHVLGRLRERCPAFTPDSLIDLGAGPGTASWAAVDLWPTIATITEVEVNKPLLDVGRRLSRSAVSEALRNVRVVDVDLRARSGIDMSAQLTIASHTLAELKSDERRSLLGAAWPSCSGALVLIEPGTPQGHRRILESRDLIIAAGGKVLAPCPHELSCPLVAPDWCHFAQRIARTRDHRVVKSAALPFEDEKFSYLIVVREDLFAAPAKHRILAPLDVSKAGLTVKLCKVDGSCAIAHIGKRDSEAFRQLKKKSWGDETDAIEGPTGESTLARSGH
jgi:ribosomal protein RSM22 (predicted rRNA methylase)